ncbi:MAG: metallophosphoesterase, partial [Clostridia bacterium]|nr:metallophosphoesterase [Clostridia bacterium]
MTYVMSDIHGMLGKFVEMLDKIGGIGAGDRLYILGDMIDRGKDGILVLQKIMDDRRIIPIIGNHESFALPILKAIKNGMPMEWIEKSPQFRVWAADGGDLTA